MAQPKGDHFGSHPELQQVLRSAVAERARGEMRRSVSEGFCADGFKPSWLAQDGAEP
jgi:hypothetical protein